MKKTSSLSITIIMMSILTIGLLSSSPSSSISSSSSSITDTFLVNKVFAQEPEAEQVFIAPGSADQNNEEGGFFPPEISVSSSSLEGNNIVLWTNDDTTEHTVTADDGSFDSGPISPGDNFDSTFDTLGDFGYHCSIHPFMTGVVIVE